jgi:hypothetical protein
LVDRVPAMQTPSRVSENAPNIWAVAAGPAIQRLQRLRRSQLPLADDPDSRFRLDLVRQSQGQHAGQCRGPPDQEVAERSVRCQRQCAAKRQQRRLTVTAVFGKQRFQQQTMMVLQRRSHAAGHLEQQPEIFGRSIVQLCLRKGLGADEAYDEMGKRQRVSAKHLHGVAHRRRRLLELAAE